MKPTRRELLVAVIAAAAPACALAPTVRIDVLEPDLLSLPLERWPKGENAVLLDAGRRPVSVVVVRHGPGAYTALSSRCTHQGCEIRPHPTELRCPCHGSAFSFDGAVRRGPASRDLKRYETELDGDYLFVRLETSS